MGSRYLEVAGSSGLDETNVQDSIVHALKEKFRPAFLSRIDDIITFHALTKDNIQQIAAIQIEKLNDRLKLKDLKVHLDNGAMKHLAQKGYDPTFGARPLKRIIQQELENPLSIAILKGEFDPEETIHFIFDDNEKKLKIQPV